MTNTNDMHSAGVDWGSTGFRAYRFDAQSQLIDMISTADGIKSIQTDQFESTLFKLIGHWLGPGSTVMLSGMITSRTGWMETPYIPIPAKLNSLLSTAKTRSVQNIEFIFLPGISQTNPRADVIRGEELQLFGATSNMPSAMVVMPGTHSKWATVIDGTVTAFQTIVTGELFDTLLNNTLVGQLAVDQAFHEDVFRRAVQSGYESNTLVAELFQCRSRVLLGTLQAEQVHSYLSGLLIGNEIREAQIICGTKISHEMAEHPIVLIGSDELCERYQNAFSVLNLNCSTSAATTTPKAFAALLRAHHSR